MCRNEPSIVKPRPFGARLHLLPNFRIFIPVFLKLRAFSSIVGSSHTSVISGQKKEKRIMKVSEQTLRMINQLPSDTRVKVDQVIRTHVAACRRTGSPIENLDRLFIEAVEIVKLEERCPETRLEYSPEWEPLRRYDQYLSPRDL
jgi:hypothetical protein